LTSAISGETQTPSGANDGEVSVIEFVANYSAQKDMKTSVGKESKGLDRGTHAHSGYQIYDARRVVDPEWNEFFGGGKAQVTDYSMGEMSV